MQFSSKNMIIGIVIGLLMGVSIGYALTVNQASMVKTNLLQQVDTLESQVVVLQNDLTTKNTLIVDLQSQISEKNIQITSLQSDVQTKSTQIASLQLEISYLEQTLADTPEVHGIYFSPNGGCEDQLLYWISKANSTIHILIYSFTLDSIGDALIEAYDRGVDVLVVFEKKGISSYSEYERLKTAGISVRNDSNSQLMHNKIMIVDGIIVITGSFNYSNNAEENNNENIIVLESSLVVAVYEEEFNEIWDVSQAPVDNGGNGSPTEFDIVISSVHYDAAGNDWDNLNDEYVIIANQGSDPVDMTGWILKDEANHEYVFPSFTLEPGNTVTVYTGSGINSQTKLYWGSGAPIWNNSGDIASLFNQVMESVTSYSW